MSDGIGDYRVPAHLHGVCLVIFRACSECRRVVAISTLAYQPVEIIRTCLHSWFITYISSGLANSISRSSAMLLLVIDIGSFAVMCVDRIDYLCHRSVRGECAFFHGTFLPYPVGSASLLPAAIHVKSSLSVSSIFAGLASTRGYAHVRGERRNGSKSERLESGLYVSACCEGVKGSCL